MTNMLKDAENHWVEKLPISKELRDEMIKEIAKRMFRKLAAVKEFLKIDGYEDICAGLYSFALEEYGKILLLQSYPTADIIEIKYKDGFRNHHKKLNLVHAKFPEYVKLNKGEFNRKEFNFQEFNVDIVADLEARQGVFHTDFTECANGVMRIPSVEKAVLEKAVIAFEKAISKQSFP